MGHPIQTSAVLKDVRYGIRGQVANRAFDVVFDRIDACLAQHA